MNSKRVAEYSLTRQSLSAWSNRSPGFVILGNLVEGPGDPRPATHVAVRQIPVPAKSVGNQVAVVGMEGVLEVKKLEVLRKRVVRIGPQPSIFLIDPILHRARSPSLIRATTSNI